MTNRIGIHALVWVGGWSPEEAQTAIASSAEAGYDLIELAALDPESFDADMTARLLQEHGSWRPASRSASTTRPTSPATTTRLVAAGRRPGSTSP